MAEDAEDYVRDLEEAVRVLTSENDALTERSEDTLLLGLIAERLGTAREPGHVLQIGLEQVALLKDVPFCACCVMDGHVARVTEAYLSESNRPVGGTEADTRPALQDVLAAGPVQLDDEAWRRYGLQPLAAAAGFVPTAGLAIGYRLQDGTTGFFLFADDRVETRLAQVGVMLRRVAELLAARLDTMHLLDALQAAKQRLEARVAERTSELDAANRELRREMAEQARLADELRQAQKMESVGRLAGGIAHDFNNLLTSILGNVELVLEELNPADPIYEPLTDVRKAGESAAALTRQLLAFSRKQVIEPKRLSVNALIANMQRMLERIIGEDVALETRLSPAAGVVWADAGQIEQVIVNLVVNARDAMPGGGALVVESGVEHFDDAACVRRAGAVPGRYVVLAVHDTGHGMDAETMARMFDPFFTTKPRGTGLGLAMVYGAVTQNRGVIDVTSTVGRGTTFRIYLPESSGTAEPSGQNAPCRGRAGTETILLVEDEALVRDLARRALCGHGYTVLAADSGPEALLLAARHEGPIDLLHFLGKPYTPQTLADKVRDVLDAR